MSTERAVRVLPADVFDYLELSALVEDGIGHATFSNRLPGTPRDYGTVTPGTFRPCCIHGHGGQTKSAGLTDVEKREIVAALTDAGIGFAANDDAVIAILAQRGVTLDTTPGFYLQRVTWDEYVAELNIVRGDA